MTEKYLNTIKALNFDISDLKTKLTLPENIEAGIQKFESLTHTAQAELASMHRREAEVTATGANEMAELTRFFL